MELSAHRAEQLRQLLAIADARRLLYGGFYDRLTRLGCTREAHRYHNKARRYERLVTIVARRLHDAPEQQATGTYY